MNKESHELDGFVKISLRICNSSVEARANLFQIVFYMLTQIEKVNIMRMNANSNVKIWVAHAKLIALGSTLYKTISINEEALGKSVVEMIKQSVSDLFTKIIDIKEDLDSMEPVKRRIIGESHFKWLCRLYNETLIPDVESQILRLSDIRRMDLSLLGEDELPFVVEINNMISNLREDLKGLKDRISI